MGYSQEFLPDQSPLTAHQGTLGQLTQVAKHTIPILHGVFQSDVSIIVDVRADIGKNIAKDFVRELECGVSATIASGRKRVAKVIDAGLGHFVLELRSRSNVVEEFHVQRRSARQKELRLSRNNLAGVGQSWLQRKGKQRISAYQSPERVDVHNGGRRVSSTKYVVLARSMGREEFRGYANFPMHCQKALSWRFLC